MQTEDVTWVFGRSTEKCTGHTAIDLTDFDRDQPSRHYASRTFYRIRALKIMLC